MDLMLLRQFQRQVEIQCNFILIAARDINAGLQNNNVELVFYGVQNFLNAAANVSKALYGGGGKMMMPRKPLRDSIGVGDEGPFREVNMRNNFEHIDARLDCWWKKSKQKSICDMNIMPRSSVVGFEDLGMFRNFDPHTTDVIFWDQDFNIRLIVDEVMRILPKVTEEASKPH